MNFQEAQDKFTILEQKWKAGLINQESYRAVLANLRVTDGAGQQWMMQEHTGDWFVLRGSQWVRAMPPQTGPVMVQRTGQQRATAVQRTGPQQVRPAPQPRAQSAAPRPAAKPRSERIEHCLNRRAGVPVPVRGGDWRGRLAGVYGRGRTARRRCQLAAGEKAAEQPGRRAENQGQRSRLAGSDSQRRAPGRCQRRGAGGSG